MCFVSDRHWLLLTTSKITWQSNDVINQLLLSSIESVDIDEDALLREGALYKKNNQEIKVTSYSGTSFTIDTGDSGGDLIALISSIDWAAKKIRILG